jgi:hypothetical protein
MKKSILFFSFHNNHLCLSLCLSALAAIFSSFETQAQTISTGQTDGEKIIYHDVNDISIESDFWGEQDGESMDLNDSGTSDVFLWTNWIYYSHIGYEALDAGANLQAPVEFSVVPDNPTAIRKHAAGELIDNSLYWATGNLIFYCVSSSGYSGSFSGEGYVAYRICAIDTTYGWIHVIRNLSSGSRLTIYDFAYTTFYTGLGENSRSGSCKIAVSDHKLFVHLPGNSPEYLLQVFDLSGKLLFKNSLPPGDHSVDLSGLTNGMFIIRLSDDSGRYVNRKIIVTG